MIPASYMFKDLYRNHWEVETVRPSSKARSAPSVPPAMPSGGMMRAAFKALARAVRHQARPSHGFGL